jgi:NADPH:quinone reductase-like Zn-dependent oxidoreductase
MAAPIDLVFDLVAGATQERSWSVLKPGGVLVSALGQPSPQKAAQHKVRAIGFRAQPNAAELAELGRLIDDGKVRVVIAATFPLARVREAEELLERGHERGKIVVRLAA